MNVLAGKKQTINVFETIDWLSRCAPDDAVLQAKVILAPFGRLFIDSGHAGKLPMYHLPVVTGGCYGIIVFKEKHPLLKKAVILPFRWIRDREDSPNLPPEIKRIAGSVRKTLEIENWGLRPWFCEEDQFDLNSSRIKWDSIWAPLAAGLYLAKHGGTPYPFVFSTGKWRGNGFQAVDDIEEKIDGIYDSWEMFAKSGTDPILFVPANNYSEAKTYAANSKKGRGLVVRHYPIEPKKCHEALREQLFRMFTPPRKSDPLHHRLAYANHPLVRGQRKERQEYYLEFLLDDLVSRDKERPDSVNTEHIKRLALGIGRNYELPIFLLKRFHPETALIICTSSETDGTEQYISNVKEAVPEVGIEPYVITDGNESEDIDVITRFLRGNDPETAAVDITGGTKLMSAILIAAARQAGAGIYYLRHKYEKNTQVFGEEILERLEWLF